MKLRQSEASNKLITSSLDLLAASPDPFILAFEAGVERVGDWEEGKKGGGLGRVHGLKGRYHGLARAH